MEKETWHIFILNEIIKFQCKLVHIISNSLEINISFRKYKKYQDEVN